MIDLCNDFSVYHHAEICVYIFSLSVWYSINCMIFKEGRKEGRKGGEEEKQKKRKIQRSET